MNEQEKSIDVLLPVYNGESYLAEQLDSIIAQDFLNWKIIALDDCSTDSSVDILNEYRQKYSKRIFVHCSSKNRGVVRAVSKLLSLSSAPYIALADQDDIWFSDRLSKGYSTMEKKNAACSAVPVLVFSDLEVFISDSRERLGSFWKIHKIDVKDLALSSLLTRNIGTGCTFLFNRSLASKLSFPDGLKVHDWWIILNAIIFGDVEMLSSATVRYRVHSKNSVGIEDSRNRILWKYFSSKNLFFQSIQKIREGRDYSVFQAKLLKKHLEMISSDVHHSSVLVDTYAELGYLNWFKRKRNMVKYRFFSGSLIMHLIRIIFY